MTSDIGNAEWSSYTWDQKFADQIKGLARLVRGLPSFLHPGQGAPQGDGGSPPEAAPSNWQSEWEQILIQNDTYWLEIQDLKKKLAQVEAELRIADRLNGWTS